MVVQVLAKTCGNAGCFRKKCRESMVSRQEISTQKTAAFIHRDLREWMLAAAFLDTSMSSTDN
ncbi:hypothetical protein DBR45_04700 [Pseudomonas sp. HMWF031]|jgi:hypothetical protein|nr:hypothetical protein DBR45_04700 [Pseudomonas sp. HMWF031]